MLNITQIREQFPILNQKINDYPLVYLDNAATSQKPLSVIKAWEEYYLYYNANVHRGIHTLSQRATEKMEHAREKVRKFIGAEHLEEIIFTKGTTEGINLIASSGRIFVKEGDNIILSALEHHSNIVPWQLLSKKFQLEIRVLECDATGQLDIEQLEKLVDDRTRFVSFNYISNALGVINPVEKIISIVREKSEAIICIDAAQAAPHMPIDVQKLDCDFLCFSPHKMYAPMGTGILYGKKHLLEAMPPYQGGGEMIATCSFKKTTFAALPFKFEAGTPNVGGNIALGAAIDFINDIGILNIKKHEDSLISYLMEELKKMEVVEIYSPDAPHAGAISFNLKGIGIASDVGMILDKMGIAVRTGHHCAQPVMDMLKVNGTVRASVAVYNTMEEIDALLLGLKKAQKLLA